jgi:hypothetical protein
MRIARTLAAEWREILRGILGTEKKKDESSIGCIWVAGFHHVTANSRLARVFKLIYRISLIIQVFFRATLFR